MRTKAEELKHNQEAQASTIAELALKATIYAQARKIEDKLEAVLVKLDLSQAQALGELAVEAVELQGKLERCYLDTPASQVKLEALQALLAQVEALEANQAELELVRAQARSQADTLLGLELFLQALGMKEAWLARKASFTPYDRSPQAQAQFLTELYLSKPKSL